MDTPVASQHRIAIPAWRWILPTFLGWSAGLLLAIALIIGVDSLGVASTQFPLAVGMGLGVGAVQGRLVAPYLVGARSWIKATTLGLSLPFIVADVLRFAGSPVPYSLAAYVALGGVLAGTLPARLLRALPVVGTPWWLVITPIGWLLAGSTVWLNELLPKTPGLFGAGRYLAVVLAGGGVLGVACAAAWQMIRPATARAPAPAAGAGAGARAGAGAGRRISRGSGGSRWCTSVPCS